MEQLTNIQAIKRFMEAQPNGRPVTMDEFKALSKAEREWMGAECAKELGVGISLPV